MRLIFRCLKKVIGVVLDFKAVSEFVAVVKFVVIEVASTVVFVAFVAYEVIHFIRSLFK